MPNYTLIHGGLKKDGRFYTQGEEVELDLDEAKKLNAEHPTVQLTKSLQAEAEAKKKAAKAAKEAEEEAALLAQIEEEEKAKKKAEAEAKKKAAGGDK